MSPRGSTEPIEIWSIEWYEILLGGLPHAAGPERIVSHLEALAELGRVVHSEPVYADRSEAEVQAQIEGIDEEVERVKRACDAGMAAVERMMEEWKRKGKIIFTNVSVAYNLLSDTAFEFKQEARLPTPDSATTYIVQLSDWFESNPGRSLLDLFSHLPPEEREHFRAYGLKREPWAGRLRRIPVEDLLLGLHELDFLPWNRHGGIESGRLPSPAYLAAWRKLDREVIHSHVVFDWLLTLDTESERLVERTEHLIGLTVPFSLPNSVKAVVGPALQAYLRGHPLVVTILVRAALEEVLRVGLRSRGIPSPEDLMAKIQTLRLSRDLSEEGAKRCHLIRIRGNKALHGEAKIFERDDQAYEVICALTEVLVELEGLLASQGSG